MIPGKLFPVFLKAPFAPACLALCLWLTGQKPSRQLLWQTYLRIVVRVKPLFGSWNVRNSMKMQLTNAENVWEIPLVWTHQDCRLTGFYPICCFSGYHASQFYFLDFSSWQHQKNRINHSHRTCTKITVRENNVQYHTMYVHPSALLMSLFPCAWKM